MRVLILITKGEVGGAQQSVFNLALGLRERRVDVTVGFDGGEFLKEKLLAVGISYQEFLQLRRTANPLRNLLFIIELIKFLKTNCFDIVCCNSSNTLFGAVAAKIVKPPVKTVFTFRGLSLLDAGYELAPIRWFYRALFWILLRFVDRQVFVSNANQAAARRLGLARSDSVIYNGIVPWGENELLGRAEAREKLARLIGVNLPTGLIIGSIGRLAYQKNYEFLIRAIPELKKKISDFTIVIIGAGPEQTLLNKLIKELGVAKEVRLLGAIPDAAAYLRAFDIFALPSRYEGMSITLIETLYAGVPVVASDVDGNAEVLGPAGLLYPLNSKTEFIAAVAALARDKTQRARLSALELERAPAFNIEKTVAEYYKLFSSLVSS